MKCEQTSVPNTQRHRHTDTDWGTFPVELQGAQQTDRLEHLCNVHLQAALQLDEEPADLWVNLPVLWPAWVHTHRDMVSGPSWVHMHWDRFIEHLMGSYTQGEGYPDLMGS